MKIPISKCHVIDLDAPTLPAYEARIEQNEKENETA